MSILNFSSNLEGNVSFVIYHEFGFVLLTMWYWQAFFAEHPEYAKNDFFITGESYAGHYIPAFASRVYRGNNNNEGIHINLKVLFFLSFSKYICYFFVKYIIVMV